VTSGPAALLVLEDGSAFRGSSFGAEGEAFGEAVFNTAMAGYQEVLTDPSYAGQIVAMTAPHQGNYGVNGEDPESWRVQVAGFAVREASRRASSWRAEGTLRDLSEAYERQVIRERLRQSSGHVTNAARSLGLERSHLYKKCKQLGIDMREET